MQEVAARLQGSATRVLCVVFSVRSGSTLLCNHLADAGLGRPTELFQEHMYPTDAAGAGRYLAEQVEATAGDVFAFKIAWTQAWELRRRLAGPSQRPDDVSLPDMFPNLRIVHLKRRDKVSQAVSWWRALATGQWHVAPGDEVAPVDRPFDPEAAAAHLSRLLLEDLLWARQFDRWGVDVQDVTYEHFIADRAATVRAIAAGLGRGAAHVIDLRPSLERMRDEWSDAACAELWEHIEADRSLFDPAGKFVT